MTVLNLITKRTLTAKLIITSTILVVFVVIVISIFYGIQQKNQFYAALRDRGLSLAKSIAYNSTYWVTIGDEENLAKTIAGIETEKDVAYIIIHNSEGEVLAKTNNGMEPDVLTGDVYKKAIAVNAPAIFNTKSKGTHIYDITVPVMNTGEADIEVSEPLPTEDFDQDSGYQEIMSMNQPAASSAPTNPKLGVVRIGMSLKNANLAINRSILVTILLTIGIVVLSVFAMGRIVRTLLNPLKKLLLSAQSIGKGNLTQKIEDYGGTDEIGQLAKAFGKMQENLHNLVTDIITEIKNNVEKIDAAAMNLAGSSREQATGAEEQSSSLTETSSTIEELASTSKQIAESVRTVAELAEKNLAGMDMIKTNTSYEANRILSLGEKSQSIGEVVAMIDEFARQTNLLALNASIEAARAGESGKGFEVVAVEIRKLATNVASSTKQIKDIIKEIQDATNASILATEKVGKSVEDGIKLSKLTAESVNQITMATQQQQSGSSQIVTAMKEMSVIAKQSSVSATQINEIAQQLTTLTTDQKKLVIKFKIE